MGKNILSTFFGVSGSQNWKIRIWFKMLGRCLLGTLKEMFNVCSQPKDASESLNYHERQGCCLLRSKIFIRILTFEKLCWLVSPFCPVYGWKYQQNNFACGWKWTNYYFVSVNHNMNYQSPNDSITITITTDLGRVSKCVRMMSPGLSWNSSRYCIIWFHQTKSYQMLEWNF